MKQEDLLRHLLSTKQCATVGNITCSYFRSKIQHLRRCISIFQKDEFLYSVLLGFRLFLSPHQLLLKLKSSTNEDVSLTSQKAGAENVCPGCGHKQKKSIDVKPPKEETYVELPPVENDFEPKRIVSMLFPLSATDPSLRDGVETLRRKRRARKRNESIEEINEENSSKMDRSSRDSGILDIDEMEMTQSASSSSNKKSVLFCKNLNDTHCLKCAAATTPSETTLARKQQLVHILHEWVRHFPADFRNKKTMWTLSDVLKSCQNENEVRNYRTKKLLR